MFGRKRQPPPTPGTSEVGLLGVGTRFEGSIRFRGTLRLDGSVQGAIRSEPGCGSVLVINRDASVLGSVVSDSVLISGKVEGDVIARERVEIYRNGAVRGDIYTGEIMVEGGASFQGTCHMIDDMDPEQQKALFARASAGRKLTPPPGGAAPQDAAQKQYTA